MSKVERSIEVDAPVSTCYQWWSNFQEFPRFMKNVVSITHRGDQNVWEWEVEGPMGKNVRWEAQVDGMEPNKVISWHSVRNVEVDTAGAVRFEEITANRTRVYVSLTYNPPAGVLGEAVARIFKNPDATVQESLEEFKRLVETEPSPVGRSGYGATTYGTSGGPAI